MVTLLLACTSGPDSGLTERHEPATYPLSDEVYTALTGRWAPTVPATAQSAIDEGALSVYDLPGLLEAGLGVEWADGTGGWSELDELDPGFEAGTPRRQVAWIWQAADPQVIDEESPIRLSAFEGIYRPQGHLTPQTFEAHVRTARRLQDLSRDFDFALIAGDLSDGAQLNELEWVIDTLEGGAIDPDSGVDDDPVPGPGNDYNDPFLSDGLGVPWYAAAGNHDGLYIGGFAPIDQALKDAAMGDEVYDFVFPTGFRDGSTLYGDLVTEGTTPADPAREPLTESEFLQVLLEAPGLPEGHGITAEMVAAEQSWFTAWPIEGVPLRLVVLDTLQAHPSGLGLGSQGYVEEDQLSWLEAQLREAEEADELVLVMSHHRAKDLGGESPIEPEQLEEVLASSPNLVLHVTGHGHSNVDRLVSGEHGYYELMLASTMDFPMQSRVIEIIDEGNGHLSIYCTNLGHNSPEDSLAHTGRQLAAAKAAFPVLGQGGDALGEWESDAVNQNLVLRVPLPESVQSNLSQVELPEAVLSEEVLLEL
jgi:3',5'-cyclic AMP phosphodiesterase CpdA